MTFAPPGLFDVVIVCCLREFPQFTSVIELLHTGWEIAFGILLLYVLQKRCHHWANFSNIMGRMFLCFSLFVFVMDTISRIASDAMDESTTPAPGSTAVAVEPLVKSFQFSLRYGGDTEGLDEVSCGFSDKELDAGTTNTALRPCTSPGLASTVSRSSSCASSSIPSCR